MLSEFLGLSTGLDYHFLSEQATYKATDGTNYSLITDNNTTHSLALPLRVIYKHNLEDFQIAFSLGAKATRDFSNKSSMTTFDTDSQGRVLDSWNENLNWFDVISRFNLLVGPGITVGYKNLFINGGYDWGVLNIVKTNAIQKDIYRNQLYIKLGYQF